MALHGINMPLSMNGQEAIWLEVWKSFGLKDAEIRSYFSGPAFLPWHRMGNINRHGGPLATSWIEGQARLQQRILKRELSLQMHPVVPAFSGFVPPAFRKDHPSAQIAESTAWAGFESTLLLNPKDPLFLTIGKRFVETYRKRFGSDHLYLADVYNEMPPRVAKATKYSELQAAGEAVYHAITAGDPKGTWVMQGWMFNFDRAFWGEKETDAFLKGVPDNRMVVLDLACDTAEIWRTQAAVRKKRWISCTLHNYGGTTTLWGDLRKYAKQPITALKDHGHGQMAGMGITMEGIQQNAPVYELATDTMWRADPINVDQWTKSYAEARYGLADAKISEAWRIVLKLIYDGGYLPEEAQIMFRPKPEFGGEPAKELDQLRRAILLLVSVGRQRAANHLLKMDLVDLTKRYLEEVGSTYWYQGRVSRDADNSAGYRSSMNQFYGLLDDLDSLLGTLPEYRLSTWIRQAESWGRTDAERQQLQENARMQVTVWGGPILHDYAWKEWSGLVKSFYKERFKAYELTSGSNSKHDVTTADSAKLGNWELKWTKQKSVPNDASTEETLKCVERLLAKYLVPVVPPIDRGIAVGKPVSVSGTSEPGHGPEQAVDGRTRGGYWAASPYPQWLQVDLGKTEKIDEIQLFSFYDGDRFYRYTIEVSEDGSEWKQVVDESKNSTPARSSGRTHTFAAVGARFVRVNMLYNSANVGVHISELRVFRAKQKL